jgi:hypothetical protein
MDEISNFEGADYTKFDEDSKNLFLLRVSSGETLDFESKELNTKLINWILTDTEASKKISQKGLTIKEAIITEKLDFEGLCFMNYLAFEECKFSAGILLDRAQISSLSLKGSEINGTLKMIGINVKGQLNFKGLKIIPKNTQDKSLTMQFAKVDGCVFLDEGFNTSGEVNLIGAHIGGSLICRNGNFLNENGRAINAKRAKIYGDVLLNKTIKGKQDSNDISTQKPNIVGEVKLCGAEIGGQLTCNGTYISVVNNKNKSSSTNEHAIIAQGAIIKGPVLLGHGFKADGMVNLFNAKIGANFDCTNGTFQNKSGCALSLERAIIEGDVYLTSPLKNNKVDTSRKDERFSAEGEVNFCGAQINGQLNCKNGLFDNINHNNTQEEIYAIRAIGLAINGPLFMSEGFEAKGGVDLLNANISATVYCRGGKFIANNGSAINAERITVGGDLILHNHDYYWHDENDKKLVVKGKVILKKANIAKGLIFHESIESENFQLILENARLDTIDDSINVWKSLENINLHGCIYESIAFNSPYKCTERIIWLEKQPQSNGFLPQPYRQLAKVLDDMGYESEAKDVRIAMNDRLSKDKNIGRNRRHWLYFTGFLFGYGYKPFKVWRLALIIVIIGILFYGIGFNKNLMHQVDGNATIDRVYDIKQPRFSPVFYSLDVFLPVINLNQAENWKPTPSIDKIKATPQRKRPWLCCYISDWGFWLTLWMYFQILSGWILVTLLIGGLSGLLKER